MSKNSNEKMVEEIANKYVGSKHLDETLNNSLDNKLSKLIIKQACMVMAEWKDERAKLCFIMIAKLIKDGVLTKDCPEHIMVQQMIELYKDVENVMEG